MKHLAKKIFKTLEKELGTMPENIDINVPNYKEIENHNEAKQTMKAYLEQVIDEIKSTVDVDNAPKTNEVINKAENILNSANFIEQKGIRSLVDEDARVGYKSKTESFFGYKVEFAMLTDSRIITAVNVQNGAYVDGTEFKALYEQTKNCGISIKEAYGDKAYFRKSILDILKEDKVEAIIPPSESVYRLDESKYGYNKDSDQWFCEYGNYTVKKRKINRKDTRQSLEYTFEKNTCMQCSKRQDCFSGRQSAKRLVIGVNTAEFYEYSKKSKEADFLEKYKKRASHEWKNAEIKRFHRLDRALGYGLRSMLIQAKFTALAVNLKRIARILSSLDTYFTGKFVNFLNLKLVFFQLAKFTV